jgi:hypothetical protein
MPVLTKVARETASRNGLSARIANFGKDESGVMILLTLIFMILMLIAAGFALDFTRHEHLRYKLQATLDRCIIGAADLDNPQEPRAYVVDCFDKAGLGAYIDPDSITVTNLGERGRRVRAEASAIMPTFLLDIVGIDQLRVPAAGTAQESESEIEIVLVLDVSGSMGWQDASGQGTKLEALKVAATEFVNDVLSSDTSNGRVAIAIVTYNHSVNAGDAILRHMTLGNPKVIGGVAADLLSDNGTKCVTFRIEDYTYTAVPPALMRADHFDTHTNDSTNARDGRFGDDNLTQRVTGGVNGENWHCPQANNQPFRSILPFTKDIPTLTNHIDALVAQRWTSIDVGMRWGAMMVDPSFAPVVDGLIADGVVAPEFNILPRQYGEALKNIIVMTDGSNTWEWILRDQYRTYYEASSVSGPSPVPIESTMPPIYRVNDTADPNYGTIYVHNPASPDTGKPYCRMSMTGPGTLNGNPKACNTTGTTNPVWVDALPPSAERMTWDQVWAKWPVEWVAANLYQSSGLTANWENQVEEFEGERRGSEEGAPINDKDINLAATCDAAKTHAGVTVYSIAFAAPPRGQTAMSGCASPGRYYQAANGDDLSAAFSDIARQITDLRLTQ